MTSESNDSEARKAAVLPLSVKRPAFEPGVPNYLECIEKKNANYCKHFNSRGGCRFGDACRYQHISAKDGRDYLRMPVGQKKSLLLIVFGHLSRNVAEIVEEYLGNDRFVQQPMTWRFDDRNPTFDVHWNFCLESDHVWLSSHDNGKCELTVDEANQHCVAACTSARTGRSFRVTLARVLDPATIFPAEQLTIRGRSCGPLRGCAVECRLIADADNARLLRAGNGHFRPSPSELLLRAACFQIAVQFDDDVRACVRAAS